MGRTPVELHVGGQTYRVVASADEQELEQLAKVVDARLREVSGGRPVVAQTLLLAAMSLAHDLEAERAKYRALEERSREMLRTVLQRIDAALEATPEPAPVASEEQPTHPE
jgi:cell division protein ZapA